jgi:hypothetical protein
VKLTPRSLSEMPMVNALNVTRCGVHAFSVRWTDLCKASVDAVGANALDVADVLLSLLCHWQESHEEGQPCPSDPAEMEGNALIQAIEHICGHHIGMLQKSQLLRLLHLQMLLDKERGLLLTAATQGALFKRCSELQVQPADLSEHQWTWLWQLTHTPARSLQHDLMCLQLLEPSTCADGEGVLEHLEHTLPRVISAGVNGLRALMRFLKEMINQLRVNRKDAHYERSLRQYTNRAVAVLHLLSQQQSGAGQASGITLDQLLFLRFDEQIVQLMQCKWHQTVSATTDIARCRIASSNHSCSWWSRLADVHCP